MPVLIAIDDYQALYTPSQYGEWLSQHHRRVVPPEEVRLANAMRVLEQPPLANGLVIAAAQRAGSYSPKIRVRPINMPLQLLQAAPLLSAFLCFCLPRSLFTS